MTENAPNKSSTSATRALDKLLRHLEHVRRHLLCILAVLVHHLGSVERQEFERIHLSKDSAQFEDKSSISRHQVTVLATQLGAEAVLTRQVKLGKGGGAHRQDMLRQDRVKYRDANRRHVRVDDVALRGNGNARGAARDKEIDSTVRRVSSLQVGSS